MHYFDSDKKLFALIPARKNSKRLPNKNLLPLGKKLLIDYSLKIAAECEAISFAVCASDSDKILEHSKKFIDSLSILKPFHFIKLPGKLTTDDAILMPVVRYILNRDKVKDLDIDGVVLLQPTSPFRKQEDLYNAINLFVKNQKDVFSVERLGNTLDKLFVEGKNESPQKICRNDEQISQFGTPVYNQNGSIYVVGQNRIYSSDIWVDENCLFYKMPHERSIDIDTEFDLIMANAILKYSL